MTIPCFRFDYLFMEYPDGQEALSHWNFTTSHTYGCAVPYSDVSQTEVSLHTDHCHEVATPACGAGSIRSLFSIASKKSPPYRLEKRLWRTHRPAPCMLPAQFVIRFSYSIFKVPKSGGGMTAPLISRDIIRASLQAISEFFQINFNAF